MNITVCLKQVPDPATVEVDPITGAIDARRLLFITNPADESALELALRLRGPAGCVTALTVGPREAEPVLRDALSVGAGRVLRLWSDRWERMTPWRTAASLALGLRITGLPDLLLCGSRSTDRGSGQVPGLLAALLDWPVVTDVTQLDLDGAMARVHRRLARGAREVVEVRLPAVLALEPELARRRHASLPGLMAASRAEIPAQVVEEGMLPDGGSPPAAPAAIATRPPIARPRPLFTPDSRNPPHERIEQILSGGLNRKTGKIIEGPPGQVATAVVDFLRERGYLLRQPRPGDDGRN